MKKALPFLIAGVLVITLAAGVLTYQSVSAQASTPTPATPSQALPGKEFREGKLGGYTDSDLAAALGISVDQLQTAYQTAQNNALKDAVSQGLITQKQADALSAKNLDGRFMGGFEWLARNGIDFNKYLADALNITTDQLQSARQQAFNTRLDAAVQNGNITQEQADLIKGRQALYGNSDFQSAMKSAFETAVNNAVKAGVITQSQADQILANDAQRFDNPGFGGFFGGGHRGGGRHGGEWFKGMPGNNSAQPSQQTTPTNGL